MRRTKAMLEKDLTFMRKELHFCQDELLRARKERDIAIMARDVFANAFKGDETLARAGASALEALSHAIGYLTDRGKRILGEVEE